MEMTSRNVSSCRLEQSEFLKEFVLQRDHKYASGTSTCRFRRIFAEVSSKHEQYYARIRLFSRRAMAMGRSRSRAADEVCRRKKVRLR